MSGLLVLLAGAAIPGADLAKVTYDLRGIAPTPGALSWNRGHRVGDVTLSDGFGRLEIPLYALVGRGGVSFPLGLYYSSNVKWLEAGYNKNDQASWVGLGWGLDAPFVFGSMEVDIEPEGEGIEDVSTEYNLFWNSVRDPIQSSGTWGLKYNKYWKFEKTLDENGYVESFTLTDLNGTKYFFGHRRLTCLVLYDEMEELVDYRSDVPYRWDLSRIFSVTGNDSISIEYDDVTEYVDLDPEEGVYFTQASYLDTIRCDASGRCLAFTRESREDYEPNPKEPDIYEKEKLSRIVLKDSAGSTLWRYELHHSYHDAERGSEGKKLLLDAVQQCKPDSSGVLPAWKFEYVDNENSYDGALSTVTTPNGGTKTYSYTSYGNSYRIAAVAIDRMMGTGPDTTLYSAPGSMVTVTPPGEIGYTEYYLKTSAFGLNVGMLDSVVVYDSAEEWVTKTEYSLADTTIIYRAYDYTKSTEIYTGIYDEGQMTYTLVSQRWTTFSTLNGLPHFIKEEVSPYQPRGFSITTHPSSKHEFYRTRDIGYAALTYSGMNASGTHQLAAVYMEIVNEQVKDQGTTCKNAPIAATKTTWVKQSGQDYYRPEETIVWTGSDAACDTSVTWGSNETVVINRIDSSDIYGHVLQQQDGEGRITRYYYGDNSSNLSNSADGLQHRFLTGVSQVSGSDSLTAKTDWNGDLGLVTGVEDANGSTVTTDYDDYYRPLRTRNTDGDPLSEISYCFAREQSEYDTFDPTMPNYIRTKSFYTYDGTTKYLYSTVFTDGWGRTLQTHQHNGDNDIINAFGYYPDGLLRATYAPLDTSNSDHTYVNIWRSSADSTFYEYQSDPRRRLIQTTHLPMDTEVRPTSSVVYAMETVMSGTAKYHNYLTITATDENGIEHKSWQGIDGHELKSTVDGDYDAQLWTNVLGQPAMILPPRAGGSKVSELRSLITMSPFGREIEREEPDQNTTKTVYDRNLVPIYVQEAADGSGNDFWVTICDGFGRVSRIGKELEFTDDSWYKRTPAVPVSTYGEEAEEWRKKYTYDTNQFAGETNYSKGRLTVKGHLVSRS